MLGLKSEKIFSRKWIISYGLILIGSFILASGFVFFIIPYKIVPGGIFGISIVLHYLIGVPVGLTGLVLNIPLTIIGIRILGPKFGVKTVIGFTFTSLFIDGLTWFRGVSPLVTNDALLSAIFGGVLVGTGIGLIFKAKATSGGSDIVSMIIAKYTKMPLGQLMIMVDSVVVIIGLVAFGDWKIPLYSWIVIFITGKVIDVVLEGISYDKTLFIVTDKSEEIRNVIINEIERGGTIFEGKGMYSGDNKKMIFTVVSRRELALLEEYINNIDQNAFMSVIDANEVLGQGFKSIKEKVGQDN